MGCRRAGGRVGKVMGLGGGCAEETGVWIGIQALWGSVLEKCYFYLVREVRMLFEHMDW